MVDNDAPGSGYSEDKPWNWASRPVGACSGNYEVVVSYRATSNRTNDADYVVYDDLGGVHHQVIDQSHSGDCTYVSLGVFHCEAGGQCRVVLDGTDDGQSDAADVTTFTLIDCDEPPPPGVCAGIASVPGYEVCSETSSSCSGTYSDGSGCVAFCAAAGMDCVARYGGAGAGSVGGGGAGQGGGEQGGGEQGGGAGGGTPGAGGSAMGGAGTTSSGADGPGEKADDAGSSEALSGSCALSAKSSRDGELGWLLLLAATVVRRRRSHR